MSGMEIKMNSGGVGVGGLLLVAFVVLKLTGVISWPWFWVLAPAWIPFAVWLGIMVVLGLVWVLCVVVIKLLERKL